MTILKENFKWDLEAFASELFNCYFSMQPQKAKILGPAACVQISILTVLFHQKLS